jgi:hypothetical protein
MRPHPPVSWRCIWRILARLGVIDLFIHSSRLRICITSSDPLTQYSREPLPLAIGTLEHTEHATHNRYQIDRIRSDIPSLNRGRAAEPDFRPKHYRSNNTVAMVSSRVQHLQDTMLGNDECERLPRYNTRVPLSLHNQ